MSDYDDEFCERIGILETGMAVLEQAVDTLKSRVSALERKEEPEREGSLTSTWPSSWWTVDTATWLVTKYCPHCGGPIKV